MALKSLNMNLPVLFFSELFCLSIQILESACQVPKGKKNRILIAFALIL